MKIGIIDRAMFAVMSSTCVKELRKEHPDWNGRAIKRNARKYFIKMLKETPSIGSYIENCWKINLVGGAVWFAIYEAVEELYGRMSDELYSRMCNATYAIPIMARKYASTPFFTEKYQDAYSGQLKAYLHRLNAGEDLEIIREEFRQNFSDVEASEIMRAEQELLQEGTPLHEVQRLCDVHSALFHGATREEKIAKEEMARIGAGNLSAAHGYSDWDIDDVAYCERAEGIKAYYLIEYDKEYSEREKTIRILPDGTVLTGM